MAAGQQRARASAAPSRCGARAMQGVAIVGPVRDHPRGRATRFEPRPQHLARRPGTEAKHDFRLQPLRRVLVSQHDVVGRDEIRNRARHGDARAKAHRRAPASRACRAISADGRTYAVDIARLGGTDDDHPVHVRHNVGRQTRRRRGCDRRKVREEQYPSRSSRQCAALHRHPQPAAVDRETARSDAPAPATGTSVRVTACATVCRR